MKKFVLIALASACFMTGALSAQAQQAADTTEYDMATVSCADFVKNQDELVSTMLWLDGYVSALAENTIVSQAWMQEFTTHMLQYCQANPAKTIMDGVDAME